MQNSMSAPITPFEVVLATMGSLLHGTHGGDPVGDFEDTVRTHFGLRRVELREGPVRPLVHPVMPGRGAIVDIPLPDARGRAVIEVWPEEGQLLPPSVTKQVALLAPLGALVLAVARHRQPAPRGADLRTGYALIGSSPLIQTLRARIERVAATDFTVLIQGESGTGKELVARQLHEQSRRRRGPFVAVNCAAIVETLLEAELFGIEERTATGVRGRRGKFEHADGGTLFLDEISDLSMSAQAKLLRVMQDLSVERVGTTGTKRVDVRVVAASNRSLTEMVASGAFRADLYYRLAGVDIQVPSLRERRDDIPQLVTHFLRRHAGRQSLRLSDAARDALQTYQWPGNVRELERLVERTVALAESDSIRVEDLPAHVRGDYAAILAPALSAGDSLRAWGSRYARLVYDRCGGNKRRTCEALNISYHTLSAYLRYKGSNEPTLEPRGTWAESVSAPSAAGSTAEALQIQSDPGT